MHEPHETEGTVSAQPMGVSCPWTCLIGGDEQTSYCADDPVLSTQGPDGADHTPSWLWWVSAEASGLELATLMMEGGGSFLCNEKHNWTSRDSSFGARSLLDLQASGLSRSQLGNKCFAWLDPGVADLSRPCEWVMKLGGGLLGGVLRASLWFWSAVTGEQDGPLPSSTRADWMDSGSNIS